MRDTFPPLAVGQSLIAASLPGIGQIRGIIVDNPSGQWLYVLPVNDYVPPYTLGWSRSYPGGTVTITVQAGVGPSGQVSTQQGDPVTITIDENPVGNSQGAATGKPFIEQFTPVLSLATTNVAKTNTGPNNLFTLAAIPNKRIRLLTLSLSLNLSFSTVQGMDSAVIINLNSTTQFIANYTLSTLQPTVPLIWPFGLDLPINDAFTIAGLATFADSGIDCNLTYQVI